MQQDEVFQNVFKWVGFSQTGQLKKKKACVQALPGALAAKQEKGGELATMYLEFEYLHQKSQCEMLIGGDDVTLVMMSIPFACVLH